jgi:hypothetical protein
MSNAKATDETVLAVKVPSMRSACFVSSGGVDDSVDRWKVVVSPNKFTCDRSCSLASGCYQIFLLLLACTPSHGTV